MSNIAYFKKQNGMFIPLHDTSEPGIFEKVKNGEVVQALFKRPRNIKYHRKFFALLNIGFEAWEPPQAQHKGRFAQKNFERFRKDVIIQAGHYDIVSNINGDVRAEAKSISFGSMDDIEFDAIYNSVVNVILQKVLTNYTRDDLDQIVEEIIRF